MRRLDDGGYAAQRAAAQRLLANPYLAHRCDALLALIASVVGHATAALNELSASRAPPGRNSQSRRKARRGLAASEAKAAAEAKATAAVAASATATLPDAAAAEAGELAAAAAAAATSSPLEPSDEHAVTGRDASGRACKGGGAPLTAPETDPYAYASTVTAPLFRLPGGPSRRRRYHLQLNVLRGLLVDNVWSPSPVLDMPACQHFLQANGAMALAAHAASPAATDEDVLACLTALDALAAEFTLLPHLLNTNTTAFALLARLPREAMRPPFDGTLADRAYTVMARILHYTAVAAASEAATQVLDVIVKHLDVPILTDAARGGSQVRWREWAGEVGGSL